MVALAKWRGVCAALMLVLAPALAGAQDYPDKDETVRIIVPFAAGSGTDTFARVMASELQEPMGVPFTVENRPGFVGITGTQQGATASPDGYTLVLTSGAQLSLPKWLYKNVPYDSVEDFEHITKLGEIGFVVLVNPDVPAETLPEFLSYAKANPGKLRYGYGSTSAQLGAVMLNSMAGIDALGVPYQGQPPALTDLIAGRLHYMVADVLVASPFIASGDLRALAATTKGRLGLLPDLPTVAELALPEYEYSSWVGLAAPRGTPKSIVERLNAESVKVLTRPDVRSRLQEMGMDAAPNSPEEQTEYVRVTQERMGNVIKGAGIQPQ